MSQLSRIAKEREHLYRLIIGQLFYDGHQTLAVSLSNLVKTHPPCPPSDRLLHIVQKGQRVEQEKKENDAIQTDEPSLGCGIDLEYESEATSVAPGLSHYEICYVASHKAQCRAGAFSRDGHFIATGSVDASIKILDVDRMLPKNPVSAEATAQKAAQPNMETYPVIRTLHDHIEEITCLEFHPTEQILVSGSRDHTIKFFDFSKPSVKRAFKTIHEAEIVRCLSLHPSGDYVLVGTQQRFVRLYNVNTGQCFISDMSEDHHLGPLTAVRYSPNANIYVTASKDGDIKVWDSVSNKCINTFPQAHDSSEVCSITFSRNSKYVLSSGTDALVKLWELSMARCIIAYSGIGCNGTFIRGSQAVFNHTEDYVLFPDENSNSLYLWDARNAERQNVLPLGHNNIVRCLTHSPTSAAFLTCSSDCRARFWYSPTEPSAD